MVGVRQSITKPFEWYMPLQHTPHSGVLVWHVKLTKLKPTIHIVEFTKPTHDDMKLVVLPIMDISSNLIKAALFLWKIWLWQCHHADSMSKIKPGVRPVVLGSLENDVGILASRKAWWQLGTLDFNLICKEFNVSVPAGASLFAMVFAMVKHFLANRDEDCLQIVRQRLQDPFAMTPLVLHCMRLRRQCRCLTERMSRWSNMPKRRISIGWRGSRCSRMATGLRLRSSLFSMVGKEL